MNAVEASGIRLVQFMDLRSKIANHLEEMSSRFPWYSTLDRRLHLGLQLSDGIWKMPKQWDDVGRGCKPFYHEVDIFRIGDAPFPLARVKLLLLFDGPDIYIKSQHFIKAMLLY